MRTLIPILALSLVSCRSEFDFLEIRRLLRVDPVIDVGDVPVGESIDFEAVLESISGGDIEVGEVSVDNAGGPFFEHDGGLPYVPAAGTASLHLSFAPLVEGYHLATVSLASNAEDPGLDFIVRGRGVNASVDIWPPLLDFGPVTPPGSAQREVTVANGGDLDVEITEHTIDAPFLLATALPVVIPAGESRQLVVLFNVVEDSAKQGTLSLGGGEFLVLSKIALRGNDCVNGDPSLYDVDGDGYTLCAGDCDDADPDVHPGAIETFDLRDEDCDGVIDEGTEGYDDDGDGFSELEGDCNDNDPAVSPAADEIPGNGIDDDCDGTVDQGSTDADSDGYSPGGGDCDDNDPGISPAARELPDGIDQDCDGIIDEGTTRYDDDGDGYCEDPVACAYPSQLPGDCDDTSEHAADVYPGAVEIANGIDDDCDGKVDEGTDAYDDDGDGYSEIGGDCDDANFDVNPGATEIPGNGIDDDCDGVID